MAGGFFCSLFGTVSVLWENKKVKSMGEKKIKMPSILS